MATRADFYVLHQNGDMELLGCTSNDYDGPFEEAKTEKQYREAVREMLKRNNSVEAKWYWPWRNSHITDEVFVFQIKPSFFNKKRGIVLTKVYTEPEVNENQLAFVEISKRGNCGEDGNFHLEDTVVLELPKFERA